MENSKRGRPKGLPKTGGRKKGTRNKATMAFKETLDSLGFNVAEEAVRLFSEIQQHDLKLKVLDFIATYSTPKPKETEAPAPIPAEQPEPELTNDPDELLRIVNGAKE